MAEQSGRNKPRSKEHKAKQVSLFRKVMESKGTQSKSQRLAHIAELTECLMNEWGGARQFAIAFKSTFEDASPMVKARMMADVIHLVKITTEDLTSTSDLSKMSDAELQSITLSLLSEAGHTEALNEDAVQEEEANPAPVGDTGTSGDNQGDRQGLSPEAKEILAPTYDPYPPGS